MFSSMFNNRSSSSKLFSTNAVHGRRGAVFLLAMFFENAKVFENFLTRCTFESTLIRQN